MGIGSYINSLNEEQLIVFYRECFYTFIEEVLENNKKEFEIRGMILDLQHLTKFKNIYYNNYANSGEKNIYNKAEATAFAKTNSKRNIAKNAFRQFIEGLKQTEDIMNKAYDYYRNYATEEEQKAYRRRLDNYESKESDTVTNTKDGNYFDAKILRNKLSINNKNILTKVLDQTNLEELSKIRRRYTAKELESQITNYVTKYYYFVSSEQYEGMKRLLFLRIKNLYGEFVNKNTNEETLLEKKFIAIANDTITDMINSSCIDTLGYIRANCLNNEIIKFYIYEISKYNKELYKKYKNWESKREKRLERLDKEYELLNNEIRTNKSFDIIDYYSITGVSVSEIARYYQSYNDSLNIEMLRRFFDKYDPVQKSNKTKIEEILNEKYFYGIKFDENKNMIEGSGKELTEKEKRLIVKTLENNKIVVNKDTYNCARRRYITGNLSSIKENRDYYQSLLNDKGIERKRK